MANFLSDFGAVAGSLGQWTAAPADRHTGAAGRFGEMNVGMKIADPALSELKPEDWPKLRALETAWRRSGDEAFERMFESDPIGFVRIVGAANPRAMREALEGRNSRKRNDEG